jgi:hypothetical protein
MIDTQETKIIAQNADLVHVEKKIAEAYKALRQARVQQAECFFRMMRLEPHNAPWYAVRIFAIVINNNFAWSELTFTAHHVKEREQRAMIA